MGDFKPNPGACLPAELVTNPVFLLGKLGFALKRQAAEELEANGYSLYDYSVLSLLAQGPCATQATIADLLQLDRSQLVAQLDGLEQRGLIERRRDPNDRRRHTVFLTDEGQRQLARVRGLVQVIADDFLAALDEEERATLHGLLLRVARHHDSRFAIQEQAGAGVR